MADDQDNRTDVSAGDLIKLVPAAVLVILLIGFGAANTQKVTVDFLFTEEQAPLIIVLLATALVGAIIAALVRWRRN